MHVQIKGAFVGAMKEQFNSMKMYGINNVKTDRMDSLVPCLHLRPWVLLG